MWSHRYIRTKYRRQHRLMHFRKRLNGGDKKITIACKVMKNEKAFKPEFDPASLSNVSSLEMTQSFEAQIKELKGGYTVGKMQSSAVQYCCMTNFRGQNTGWEGRLLSLASYIRRIVKEGRRITVNRSIG